MAKLTNKDKDAIRRSLFHQVDGIIVGMTDKCGYHTDLSHLDDKDVADYCYKIIGLWPMNHEVFDI